MGVHYRPVPRPGRVSASRERIMVYGGIGSGKTRGAVDIAKRALGPDDTMWVIDADNAWDRMLGSDYSEPLQVREEWRGGKRDVAADAEDGQLVVFHARGWEQQKDALTQVFERAQWDDWIVVDDATWLYQNIQSWYYKTVHGVDLPDFMIQAKIARVQAEKNDNRSSGAQEAKLLDWDFINPVWNSVIAEPFVNAPCHLYVCAAAKEIRSDGRQRQEVSDLYGGTGYQPSSQWRLGGQMNTVLFLEQTRNGRWRMSTVKDRELERVERMDWDNFFGDYLRKIAGWKVAR